MSSNGAVGIVLSPESVIPIATCRSVLHVLLFVFGCFFQYHNLILRTTIAILSYDSDFNLVIIFHFVSLLSIKNKLKNSFISFVVFKNVCFSCFFCYPDQNGFLLLL